MTVSLDKKVVVPDGVMIRDVAGESVLLNLNNEQYYGLDEVGTRMWKVLTESDSIQHAIEQLLAEYEVDQKTLEKDVQELLKKLMEQGLIRVDDP
jgi:hypothetical protein